MPFTIRVLKQSPSALVELSGELDIGAASTLRVAITDTLDEEPRDLRLDLSALTFVDAAGMQALARARAEAIVRGAQLEIEGWSWALDRVAVRSTGWVVMRDAPRVDL